MGYRNSLEELILNLYCDLFVDIAERFNVSAKESRLELRKIRNRVSSEGISFLTKSLPRFGKAVDTALSKSTLLTIIGFEKQAGSVIPKFLGWLLNRVFTDIGAERPDADPEALRALRQLVYFVYKLEIPHDEATARKTVDQFVETDRELSELVVPDDEVTKYAAQFASSVFGLFDFRNVSPRHGPGSVATGEAPNEKHLFKRLYRDIERIYPFTEYFQYSLSQVCDSYKEYEALEVLDSGTAKVVLVPKDSRGPRLISCEPLEYQWIQQGLGRRIAEHLEAHRLTAGHVNFTDQRINRELALEASLTQEWVTLDMKDASDRVSLQLVEKLFQHVPYLLEALKATRTTATRLPDGREVRLNKFAPMGSCLCFPIEAFVFYALAVSVLVKRCGWRPERARRSVYVYGDDLIVDRAVYAELLQYFPLVGLMFNEAKCCTAGSFRESCGCDAFKGVDVTPVKLRSVWSHRKKLDVGILSSYVSLSNEMYARGYIRVSERARALVLSRTRHPLPVFSNKDNGGLGWVRHDECTRVQPLGVKTRWNDALHRREAWTLQSRPEYCYSDPDDWSTVLRRSSTPDQYTTPGTYAVPHRSRPQWGWTHVK